MERRLKSPAALLLLLAALAQMTSCVSGANIAKRSLSALARTSQLPHSSSAPADQSGHEHGGQNTNEKRSELQEEAIREELLRQRAAPISEALLSAIMAADQYGYDNDVAEKRSLSSLARYGNMPVLSTEEKRSLASLARYGNLPAPAEDKRSLSALARYGNLPAAVEDKRSLSALARYGNLPAAVEDKRSLSALARYGNLPAPASPSEKRSLEALARGGLLTKNSRVDNNKRSVAALAKAGELPRKRWGPNQQREDAQDLLDMLQRELDETKRGISSLARSGEMVLPQVKRSLESLARTWNYPEPKRAPPPYGELLDNYPAWALGKRNAATLLRQTKFTPKDNAPSDESQSTSEHHNAQGRRKRSLWDEDMSYGEVALPFVQSTASGQEPDWEPLWSPSAWGAYFGYGEDTAAPPQQKRFLGSVARSWGPSSWRPASPANPGAQDDVEVSKRHIGTLARSGLLPAFRSLRYARSGRAVAEDEDGGSGGSGGRPVRYRRVCFYR